MFNPTLETPVELANAPRGPSLGLRCTIVAVAVALAGTADLLIHVVWLPSQVSQLAVQQLRPDDAVAEAVRGVTYWANWSHAILAIVASIFALALLYPVKQRIQHALHTEGARHESAH